MGADDLEGEEQEGLEGLPIESSLFDADVSVHLRFEQGPTQSRNVYWNFTEALSKLGT